MKKISILLLLLAGVASAQTLKSPDGKLQLDFMMSKGGIPYYTLKMEGKPVVTESRLGVVVKDDRGFTENMAETTNPEYAEFDETWQPVLGEVKEIRNRYNQMKVTLQQIDTKKPVVIVFRLFDDGLGFRYEFP